MATKKKVAKKKAKKKKIAKKKVANKTTKKNTVKKATPKRKPVVKRSNASTKPSTLVKTAYQDPPKDSKRTEAEIKSNVEQPTEDVMSNGYGEGSPAHQTVAQEDTFNRVIKRLCTDENFRKQVVEVPETLVGFDLSPEQQLTLIAVGHASGRYTYKAGEGYCCCAG